MSKGPRPGVVRIVALAVISCAGVFAQSAATPAFDAASVKPADPKLAGRSFPMAGGPGTSVPGLATFTNVSLNNILAIAYGVRRYQLTGPAWLDSARYTLALKIPPETTKEQY